MRVLSVVAAGLAATLLAACGSGETTTVVEKVTTVTQTVESTAAPADGASADLAAADAESIDDDASGSITVPDVVGKDHQLAQDTMQAEGLYSLREEDATGQDRLLIIDRNWTVVRQDPPAGTEVGPDETITLYSKKDGE